MFYCPWSPTWIKIFNPHHSPRHDHYHSDWSRYVPFCTVYDIYPWFLVGSVLLLFSVFCARFLVLSVCFHSVSCAQSCMYPWIVLSWFSLQFSLRLFSSRSQFRKQNFWASEIYDTIWQYFNIWCLWYHYFRFYEMKIVLTGVPHQKSYFWKMWVKILYW